jgi:hypothetical protein
MLVSKIFKGFRKPGAPPEQTELVSAPATVAPSQGTTVGRRVTLLIALAIPVFLETLDYTGLGVINIVWVNILTFAL